MFGRCNRRFTLPSILTLLASFYGTGGLSLGITPPRQSDFCAVIVLIMNDWSRGEIISLIGLGLAVISCIAAILAVPNLRKLFGFRGKELWIHTPKNKQQIFIQHGEHKPIVRAISGEIAGYRKSEIERLGLFVEVHIKTDKWYPQGNATVESDGKWTLTDAYFGGTLHVIKAVLKDRYNRELQFATIEVSVS